MSIDLDHELAAAARRLDVPAGDLDAVVDRADRRSRHRRLAMSTLSVLTVAAVTAAALSFAGRGGQGAEVATTSGVSRGAVGITWQRVAATSGLGYALSIGGDGQLYALSTAPGQANLAPGGGFVQTRVVWRSEDGIDWTPAKTLGNDLYLSDLTSRDGRVYAVGTGPAAAAVAGRPMGSDVLVGWSDDGGTTWQRTPLPIDMQSIAAKGQGGGITAQVLSTKVAAGPAGVVAAGVPIVQLDVPALLPEGTEATNGWAFTTTGVDLLGPGDDSACPPGSNAPKPERRGPGNRGEQWPIYCETEGGTSTVLTPQQAYGVERHVTWAELGVDGDVLRAVLRQPIAFHAPSGSTAFERVELPALGPNVTIAQLEASDSGFDLIATSTSDYASARPQSRVVLLHSDDGRTWAPAGEGPPGIEWVQTAGQVDGRLVIVGQNPSGAVVSRQDEAGGWVTTPLADAIDPGLTAGTENFVASADIGPLGVAAVVTLSPRDGGGRQPPSRLLVSRDGTTWSDQAVEEVAGQPLRGIIRVLMHGPQLLVTVSVPPAGTEDADGNVTVPASAQVVLVGTAA